MSLAPASRLGPYEIVARLGAGAMGEVYRARDTRLGREVAIKILPADVAADAGRRARFEQEARAVAALNHPNILGLYDIGVENDTAFIVTELVTGEPLETLLAGGPLPIKKLLDLAVQIADGMAAAHAAHITHRDLKPANIMVSTEGRVKILDFGLAKQAAPALSPDETMTVAQTMPGMILGTINYMSPEQARGKPADHRSDQFSFGIILYEMATGKKAFARPESVQTMSAILTEDPPPIERNIPAPLRWTIDRCLAKEPADRYDSSRDLFHELRGIRDHLSQSSTIMAPPAAAPRRKLRLPWKTAAAFVAGVVLAAILLPRAPRIADQSAYRFTPFSFFPGGQCCTYWSPDGKAVAYGVRLEGTYQTFLRYLDQPTPVQLTHGTVPATPMQWTPDGKRLLLGIDQDPPALWSVATVGGDPEVVVPKLPYSRAATISPDTKTIALVYPKGERYGVWIASPLDAQPQAYTPDPFATIDLYNNPQIKFSPDGKKLLLILNAGRGGEEAWLLPYPSDPKHPPHRVLQGLESFGGTPSFGWMPDNRHVIVAFSNSIEAAEQLWLADLETGERHALTSGTTPRIAPAVSPDGGKLIFHETGGNFDIVSVDLATAAAHPLIATERDEDMPSWAAKQPVLVYVSNRNGPPEIWLHTAAGDRPVVTGRDFPQQHMQWFMSPALSPEADRVIYTVINQGNGSVTRLYISALTGGAPVPLTNDVASGEFSGSWSPDGSWFTYLAFNGGKINLMKVKTSGQAKPVAVKADVQFDYNAVPAWSPDGKWIVLGENLYSSDGQTVQPLGDHKSEAYVFSADGKLLYGIRSDGEREALFTVNPATGAEKVIGNVGQDFRPLSHLNPSIRLSLAPDGKTIVYGTTKRKDNLWMLEGFSPKPTFWSRLGL
jgi:eukaryotic-like serine/threonine-protein kinase